jgi:two-component system cell cycle sensor histidine kinase/response regulator CckA
VTNLDADAGCARVDPSQFDQVIVNLVVNARDAMPDGGRVTICTGYTSLDQPLLIAGACVQPGEYVSISVADTGVGMAPEVLRHIFEPFFSTKAQHGRGTGLGLATVYGIVKQHSGFIFASSTPGSGARFDILLPRTVQLSPREPCLMPEIGCAIGNEHVLLVEDEDALRRLGADILRRQGYTVTEARDGVEALDLLEELPDVSLVLTDVIMPRMGGPELAARAAERWPEVKMLFTSGYVDEALGQSRSLPEGTHFIAKPFTRADLSQAVRSVLDGAKPVRPS